jgi:DNA-directed RNA polymerase specialized sigma24 family protein
MNSSSSRRRRWELTPEAFKKLLTFLSPDPEESGRRYEDIRRRLVTIFTCRGSSAPEELADETIDRVAKKIEEIGKTYVGNPSLYFYGVARKVFLESVRKRPHPLPLPEETPPLEKEMENECLEQCMRQLIPRNRELIVEYYRYDRAAKIQHRKELAERMDVAVNALRIRAHRIRNNLQKCVFRCIENNSAT